jgi:hypothetical protein
MRSRLLSCAALLLALLGSGPAAAYTIMRSSTTGKELRWTSLPMKFNVEQGAVPGLSAAQCQAAIKAAYQTWSAVSCSVFSASYTGLVTAGTATTRDRVNTHAFPSSWSSSFPQNALGFTRTSYDPSSGKILDADIFYNPRYSWSSSGAFSAYDLQSVATHEIGHEMGFDHSSHSSATMYHSTPNGATHQRSLHSDDIAAACYLYANGKPLPPECTHSSQCAPGETCSGGKCVKGTPAKKPYGATCSSSSECSSNLCISSAGKGLCSRWCNTSACPSGDRCVNISGGGRACLPGSASPALGLGQTCNSSLDCKSNLCVTLSGNSFCTQRCDVAKQNCPDGFKCTGTSIGGICEKGTKPGQPPPTPPKKDLGQACSSGTDCNSGLCGDVGRGPVCLTPCDRARPGSCGAGFKCVGVANSNQGACVKDDGGPGTPPPGKGGLGAQCTGNADCQSGLCVTDGASGRRFCSRLCDPTVGCGQGFACVPAGGGAHACRPTAGPGNPADPGGDGFSAVGCSVAQRDAAPPGTPALWLLLLPLALLGRGRRCP